MSNPRVLAVIVNWNGRDVLPRMVASLQGQDYHELQPILVDNASSDGSCDWVAKQYPDFHIIRNKTNLGFAGGGNTGIQEALKRDADYVLLANNDVILEKDTVRQLVGEISSDPQIGLVGPSVWRADNPELLDSAYGVICFNHVIVKTLGISRANGRGFLAPKDVQCLFGSILLIRADVFGRCGLLDEAFWMFLEEVDFCYRAGQNGLRVRYFPLARVYHYGGYSIKQAHAGLFKTYLVRRNAVLFLKKHGDFIHWCKFLLWVALSLTAQFFNAVFRLRWALFRERWTGYRDGFRGSNLPQKVLRRVRN